MYEARELIIDPEFQRMFRWSEGAQSRFIESLLLELPVPPIFLIEREDRVYELIDGLQRISSYLHFRGILKIDDELQSPLTLADCDIVTELNGLAAQNLPRALDIKLKRSYTRAEILRKESDPRLRYYMFKRLNTGGEVLSEQEIRNATIRLLDNTFNAFLMRLSTNTDFQSCIGLISDNQRKRRFDQELVLRFFAFKNKRDWYRHDVADFLTDYMEAVSDPTDHTVDFDYTIEEAIFTKTFAVLRRAATVGATPLGDRLFGSVVPGGGGPRGQFSIYHYEGITLGLQSILGNIDVKDEEFLSRVGTLISQGKADPAFLRHTGAGKNDPNPLRERIEYFSNRFSQLLS
ncbi:MAG: DUF262 domain-containing protein [Acidobacteriota bacterium]|nr:DUF262 domain-containing protein [Acidobacteriota bacterium]